MHRARRRLSRRRTWSFALFACVPSLWAGCFRAPDLVIVDRKTALEQQAAGSFDGLAEPLAEVAVPSGPVPYTRAELERAGVPVGQGDEALGRRAAETDAERIDELLRRRCIGEGLDGTLVATPATCTSAIETSAQAGLVERANRRRFQVWRYLETGHPGGDSTMVRRAWREQHLGAVVCGAQVQRADGTWEAKKC